MDTEEGDGQDDTNVAVLDAARLALSQFNYKDGAGCGETGKPLAQKKFDDFVRSAFVHAIERAAKMGEKAFAEEGSRKRKETQGTRQRPSPAPSLHPSSLLGDGRVLVGRRAGF